MIYSIKSIKNIFYEKIMYCDNAGNEKEIDLSECNKNWIEYIIGENHITAEGNPAPKLSVETDRCVGERDWSADKPYFEFFSIPKTRFEIQPKRRLLDYFNRHWPHCRRYYLEFHEIQKKLAAVGWTTYDLS